MGGCRAVFSCRHAPIGMMRPRKKYFSTLVKEKNMVNILSPSIRTKYQFGDELPVCGLRCTVLLLLNLISDVPRDYDELAEDEDANPGGSSSLDVNMEDANAILNEDDTESGNPSSPPAPLDRQGGKPEFPLAYSGLLF